jgi:hypothetical protein
MLQRYGRFVPSLPKATVRAHSHTESAGRVRDKVDGHFALRRLDRAVRLARRDRVALAEKLRREGSDGTRTRL